MVQEQPLVCLENLTLGYEKHPAVHHLSGHIYSQDLLAVVGPNGAGKSTLLKGLMQELRPLGGRIGWPQGKISVAYLPQRSGLNLDFPLTVEDFVSLGHWPRLGAFAAFSGKRRQQVRGAMEAVGMQGFEQASLESLSGGQLQRILFARLLLEDAQLLLLDEPFAAVDEQTTSDLLHLVQQLNREGKTLVAVLHDLHQVREYFPQTLLLARDLVDWGPTVSVLTQDNLEKARGMRGPFDPLADVCETQPGSAH
ncbi:metal ABC transporter ATP-binding protein [Marinospirillum perlucidum]|uniref:metal ABC transporter ATP-binding protein n=1 Tax=Marinospirillum perlucidum TaxID=1982602 RepID=UPI000DF464AA|nr:metal ABC transporter ATP-binding protein [Marinospirillum perlucidum]